VKNLECEVIIVSDHSNVMGLQLPSNVHLLVDIPYPKYLELLFDCQAVIVPLKKVVKSTGQVAFLEAMALGKPVIATETVGTVDYIQSGFNGILVAPDDVDGLKKAILQIMADKDLYQCLSVNALKSVKELHTFEVYVDTILKAAKELAG
jgi:glycosyltransferase involved in cell wall biosynthesis